MVFCLYDGDVGGEVAPPLPLDEALPLGIVLGLVSGEDSGWQVN